MKKRLLQIGSFLMALAVLFVSVGWDVKFHYCTEDHQLSGSFGAVVDHCLHCLDHEHEHEETDAHLWQLDGLQFNAKCCCDDFDSKIQFTDNFVFSPDKHLIISIQQSDIINRLRAKRLGQRLGMFQTPAIDLRNRKARIIPKPLCDPGRHISGT